MHYALMLSLFLLLRVVPPRSITEAGGHSGGRERNNGGVQIRREMSVQAYTYPTGYMIYDYSILRCALRYALCFMVVRLLTCRSTSAHD